MKEAKQEDIINELQRKIESWRATKTYRDPIPNQLWQPEFDLRFQAIANTPSLLLIPLIDGFLG